jgi:hypothetical protein
LFEQLLYFKESFCQEAFPAKNGTVFPRANMAITNYGQKE